MFWKKIRAGMFRFHSVVRNGFMRLCRGCQARFVLDCKTVGFFSKSVKKSVKRGVRVLRARSARASYAGRTCEAREKKSLPSLALCFRPRSRPFFDCSHVLEYAKIRTVLQSTRFRYCKGCAYHFLFHSCVL